MKIPLKNIIPSSHNLKFPPPLRFKDADEFVLQFQKCQTKVAGHLKGNGNSKLVFHRDNNVKTLLCVSDTL